PDAALDRDLEESLLAPLGCRAFADAVTPVCALSEHGGMILSMRDHLGQLDGGSGVYRPLEIGVERRALREGRVVRVRETDGRWGDGRVVARVAAFGYPMPEVALTVVDPSSKITCPSDRVGEIWVDSPALSGGFWGLPKHTMSIFRAKPSVRDEHGIVYGLDREFLRTGLMGMMVEDQVFVLGVYEDRVRQVVWSRPQGPMAPPTTQLLVDYAPDIMYTLMAHVPGIMTCTAFDRPIAKGYGLVVLVESEERKEEWLGLLRRVCTVLTDYHSLRPWCVAICPVGGLPRVLRHGRRLVHVEESRRAFLGGALKILYLTMGGSSNGVDRQTIGPADGATDDAEGEMGERDWLWSILGLAPPPSFMAHPSSDDDEPSSHPAHTTPPIITNHPYPHLPQWTGVVETGPGRIHVPPSSQTVDHSSQDPGNSAHLPSIVDALVWRGRNTPEEVAVRCLKPNSTSSSSSGPTSVPSSGVMQVPGKGGSMTWKRWMQRMTGMAQNLTGKRGIQAGDYIVLVMGHGMDMLVALYAIMLIGAIPVPLSPPDPTRLHEDIPAILGVTRDLSVKLLVVDEVSDSILRSKPVLQALRAQPPGPDGGPAHFPSMTLVIKAGGGSATKGPGTSGGIMGLGGTSQSLDPSGFLADCQVLDPRWFEPHRTACVWVLWGPDRERRM
ncbi:hypothetical protein BJ684DRAFT_22167, partial [Piptocephalis cylindrospora]